MEIGANLTDSLVAKFALLRSRSLATVEQLADADMTWAPNADSNSIANLALHIRETVRHRVEAVFSGPQAGRDRDREFDPALALTKAEALAALDRSFAILIEVSQALSEGDLLRQPFLDSPPAQSALSRDATVLDVLVQMLAHLSEHAGQIFYIAKARLDGRYVTTTLPRRR